MSASKLLLVIAVLVSVASASVFSPKVKADAIDYEHHFNHFRYTFNKTYDSENEYKLRLAIFSSNVDKIVEHNASPVEWNMDINEYADLTWEEFAHKKLGFAPRPRKVNLRDLFSAPIEVTADLPDSVDWVANGAVTGVKNQAQCGSCWAFSTTGAIEGAVFLATGQLVSLSEKNLMDCSNSYGNMGCNGGDMDAAFKYAIANKGLCTEESYPYVAADGTCRSDCTHVSPISSYHDVTVNDEDALKAAVAQQPVAVAIQANQMSFQFYSGGVLTGNCGTQLDHGVLVVGYGTDGKTDYWKVKNSWGASWGEEGYIRIQRTGGKTQGKCGIAMDPSYPIV